jgi:hypothetical protein
MLAPKLAWFCLNRSVGQGQRINSTLGLAYETSAIFAAWKNPQQAFEEHRMHLRTWYGMEQMGVWGVICSLF